VHRQELVDVGARDPRVGLAGHQHDPLHHRVALDPPEQLGELGAQTGRDLVHRLVGQIDRDDRDPVGVLEAESGHQARSTTIA
jgi:hypothetical protein